MTLNEPRTGDRISATWAAKLVRTVNAQRPIAGPGIKLRQTTGGVVITSSPGSGREPIADRSCFRYRRKKIETADGDTVAHVLENLYYQLAGRTYLWVPDDDHPEYAEFTPDRFVALKIDLSGDEPEPSIETYETFEEMQDDQSYNNIFVKPLYEFRPVGPEPEEGDEDEDDGRPLGLAVDLRTAIDCSIWEFGTLDEEDA